MAFTKLQDRPDIVESATEPLDLSQGPRFGGVTELVKDSFVTELTNFFNTKYDKSVIGELPRIDKYAVAAPLNQDPLETAVNLIRSYPDVVENLPLIAVLATTGKNRKLGFGESYTGQVIPNAKVISSGPGPYNIVPDSTLVINTQPGGQESTRRESTFVFQDRFFKNIAVATIDEVAWAINQQALYARAGMIYVSGQRRLVIDAGGPRGKQFPNRIEIVGGDAVTSLGFTVGQADKNYGAGKVAYERHHIASDLTVNLEVVTESENVRTELTDLLYDFFSYVVADRKFTFYGRSVYDNRVGEEYFQIILQDDNISISGESETNRPGDARDKIYINRISIPVLAVQYSDRLASDSSGNVTEPQVGITLVFDGDLPVPN